MGREFAIDIAGKPVKGILWDSVQEPRAMVQFVHGMAEHVRRYEEFARYLNNKGIIAGGHDHPGHGMNLGSGMPGDIGPEGWAGLIRTTGAVHDEFLRRYPHVPHYLLGHSMGSIVVRCLIHLKNPKVRGVILTGTGSSYRADRALGLLTTRLDEVLSGSGNPARLTAKLHNLQYSAQFEANGPFNWLSSDAAQVERYETDPLCGFDFPAASYRQLLGGLDWAESLERTGKPLNYPVLIAAGAKDPVGHMGRDPRKVYKSYEAIAAQGSSLRLYPGMRHEILNEIHRIKVYEDLVVWMMQQMK